MNNVLEYFCTFGDATVALRTTRYVFDVVPLDYSSFLVPLSHQQTHFQGFGGWFNFWKLISAHKDSAAPLFESSPADSLAAAPPFPFTKLALELAKSKCAGLGEGSKQG